MMTFIAVALGVMVGILVVSIATYAVVLNPRFVGWLAKKYMDLMIKVTKELEEKMDEL